MAGCAARGHLAAWCYLGEIQAPQPTYQLVRLIHALDFSSVKLEGPGSPVLSELVCHSAGAWILLKVLMPRKCGQQAIYP